MKRETENAVLLLVGICIALITLNGVFTRYVKPSLLPWLLVSAALLIVLALAAIARDIKHPPTEDCDAGDTHGHRHRPGIAWLLVVPIVMLGFIMPPAITPQAAAPTVVEVSTDVLRRPFPPLPNERAPMVSVVEILLRVAQDTTNSLDGRLLTVTGFTTKQDGSINLARVVIACCAADARLAQIRLSGPAASAISRYPEYTWLKVEGTVPSGQSDSTGKTIPVMEVVGETRIDPPANPYTY